MKQISYYDNGAGCYKFMDADIGGELEGNSTGEALPDIDGLPSQRFHRSADGRYEYFAAFNYTLRDDMNRRIRRRLYRKDTESGEMIEMLTKWDRSEFQMNNYAILGKSTFFTIASRADGGASQIYVVDLETDFDGENPREMWRGNAYPYGFNLSPDKTKMAFHLAGYDERLNPYGSYGINILSLKDYTIKHVCSEKDHLFFGPAWSPDGNVLMFSDCNSTNDHAHHFADVAVCDLNGNNFRRLTNGYPQYFSTSFGLEGHRMGGSTIPVWTNDSKILYSPMLPDSHPDCHFDSTQLSHEELIYDPSMGKGGCGFSILDPLTGDEEVIIPAVESEWNFRPHLSRDGEWLLYTHSEFGKAGEVRLMNMKDRTWRTITNGTNGLGADHARFV